MDLPGFIEGRKIKSIYIIVYRPLHKIYNVFHGIFIRALRFSSLALTLLALSSVMA